MSIYAFVGTYDDSLHEGMPIRGNGKTMAMTYFGYQAHKKGKEVFSNYHTTFSQPYTMNHLIQLFKDQNLSNVVILIDEAQVYLSNQGVKKGVLKELIGLFVAQTRKRKVDIYLTTQRFLNLNNQLRIHIDSILLPVKAHADGQICKKDSCEKHHYIHIFPINEDDALCVIDAEKVGKLYNSDEIVLDTFNLPDPKTGRQS